MKLLLDHQQAIDHGHLFLGTAPLQQRLTSFVTSVAHQDLDKNTLHDG